MFDYVHRPIPHAKYGGRRKRGWGEGVDEFVPSRAFIFWFLQRMQSKAQLEVCALCGDADPRRVCRELHFV